MEERREWRHRALETAGNAPHPKVGGVRCLDESGETVAVVIERTEDVTQIVRFDGEEPTTVYEGRPHGIDLGHGRHAFLAEGERGQRLVELDLLSAQRRQRGTLPREARSIIVNDDVTLVAGYSQDWRDPHFFVLDLEKGTFTEALAKPRSLVWIDDRRIASLTDHHNVTVYDETANVVAEWPDWNANATVVLDGVLYGIGYHGIQTAALRSAPALTGPEQVLREFETPSLYALELVRDSRPEPTPTPSTPTPEPSPTVGASDPATPVSDRRSVLPVALVVLGALVLGSAGVIVLRRR